MVDAAEGTLLVRTARRAVVAALGGRSSPAELPADPTGLFREHRGVFVTWYAHPSHGLRGCVGFPRPVLPLATGLPEAAVAAALDDPRFPSVTLAELGALVVEVSVLSPFESLGIDQRPTGVKVGRDGLVIESDAASGLLLPQVAPEQGWSATEFLEGVCEKAGLPPTAWRSPRAQLFRFTTEAFAERSPDGPVDRAHAGPPPRPRAGSRRP